MSERPWIILKFGGTSVSSRERWETIASQAQKHVDAGRRPLIVCSALSGVSDQLEQLVEAAPKGGGESLLEALNSKHADLAAALDLSDSPAQAQIQSLLGELAKLAKGAELLGELSPRHQAQALATGELMSTRLGAHFLSSQGLETGWLDARTCLQTEPLADDDFRAFLSASCPTGPDSVLQAALATRPEAVLVTQGFIAQTSSGETALLGRGGSDTSAAYFAAKLEAERLEIWTDVPGMYSADPRQVPSARLLKVLDYSEALEIATTGAKVLHPRCIHPVAVAGIPVQIKATPRPDLLGTEIRGDLDDRSARVKAISVKRGVMLISMETVGMWQQVGFLAEAFQRFADAGLSVDLVSTSETSVTVSLDPTANPISEARLAALCESLAPLCQARVIGPCAMVSLVGRNIRRILHELGGTFQVFEEQRIHLLSQAANDLNLSVVVDHDQADRLVRQLHGQLFGDSSESELLGPTWQETFAPEAELSGVFPRAAWWLLKTDELLTLAQQESPLYVYDRETVRARGRSLMKVGSLSRVYFAIKANPNPGILKILAEEGLGFECVSPGEVNHVLEHLPGLSPDRILFTPNFAPRDEYRQALDAGVHVTLDNLHPLEAWPELFTDQPILLRLDPGRGRGHHAHVKTAGRQSKFGIAPEQVTRAAELAQAAGARVVGLHAHAGSGIRSPETWPETARFLASHRPLFPELRYLDLGGGLGIPEKPGQLPLDLGVLDSALAAVHGEMEGLELWMEPGRFLVAEAGVLLARVTQIKAKAEVNYVGLDAGMNTLIRPALYGAYHSIVNLSRLDARADHVAHVVGPICETGDTLGYQRRVAKSQEGDVFLIATAGAYGRSMSSDYNLRPPANERFI